MIFALCASTPATCKFQPLVTRAISTRTMSAGSKSTPFVEHKQHSLKSRGSACVSRDPPSELEQVVIVHVCDSVCVYTLFLFASCSCAASLLF